ncbi:MULTISPECIES: protein-L-isoaspartate O-methyltransferase family protein [Halomicrobium]|uniref:protein-L-isoaspartate(D-aspartate) O-methyltransferase n=2 Tax=Halomicrobium mukohataei TaxID=57705 RepID=C7NYJ6_HALMD|nr:MULTISPECIES: protein-L-isoaspartate O-methyltransferase [Halomicrobium]ACV46657.1 Protein-L-isoaspartate(D-aspartate)O-methyltrans ferase [Halomicrobium mukohataei DSM 12286]QCD65167.1 protein-L-isoaspartate O-methyltransferase [Halomicrobium mukohataei]QFR19973.1 protein-L-isoaspartate O-methyltransferase [Halomicrobium sp. ZPS1]
MEQAVLREDMVDSLTHESKGCLQTPRLADAMRTVSREAFVEDDRAAYSDRSFERFGTRVLAPSTAARLLEALAPEADDDVLIVGVGVGYTAALVAEIVGPERVHAIDITRRLVYDARSNLATAGYEAVLVDRRDGAEGLPEYAPYDKILLEAAAVEPPRALREQLADDGRLVMPLGAAEQTLTVVAADGSQRRLGGVAFQPMLVEGEQADTVERNRTHREDRERAQQAAQSRAGWEQEWIDWDDY